MSGDSETFRRVLPRRIGFALATLAVTTSLENLPFGRVGDAHAAGSLTLVSKAYHDLDGDRDIFPDTGEAGRISFVLRNEGPDLEGAIATLVSDDSDVACIIEQTVRLGSVPAGGTVTVGSLDRAQEGLSFRAGAGLQSLSAADPARLDLCLIVVATVPEAFRETFCVSYPADLDLAGGGQAFVQGADGIVGTGDDGIILEDFDRDRNRDGALSLGDRPGGANDMIGVWVGNDPGGLNPIAVVGCGGFMVPPQDPECRIEPDYDMDWHLHCPPGSTACTARRADHHTPRIGGGLAYDGIASLHWGFHPLDAHNADTLSSTRFRQVSAFMTDPINLGLLAPAGDLELSFFQIADMMDNNSIGFLPGQASDYGDVHIQVDGDPDPEADAWGFWEKLVPFENGYDHVPYIWSWFGWSPSYCNFNPTDGGPDATAPRVFKELTCYPSGVWSHCGTPHADSFPFLWDCPGPGLQGTVGTGLWVRSRFSLEPYLGRRIRIRWIAQSWEFDCCSSSYDALDSPWDSTMDDGWWIDRIMVQGALTSAAEASADADPPPAEACPTGDQRVVDVVLETSEPPGRGSAIVRWRTTEELDLLGFNVVSIGNNGGRIVQNATIISCVLCVTSGSVAYEFSVPKHRNARDIFVEAVRRGGIVELYGPALRAPRQNESKLVTRAAAVRP